MSQLCWVMLEAHGGRLGPLELVSNSLPRAQSWKEAQQGSSESNFWPCPRWWAQSWLQLHRAFCTSLNSPCGFCRSQGWVGRENFSYLWLLWFQKKKMASAISFIKNLVLTRPFCFCLLTGGRTNPFQFQLFVLAVLFEHFWPPTVLPSQSVQRLEEWVSFWTAADWMNTTVKILINSSRVEGQSCDQQIRAFTTLWK